ncbi:DUF4097 family beta strand repeat protein [Saccharopolyspora erythraea]|uniref:DUF4097 family beta strand repeat-containing protein n=1 Tax=Saccharopolyspora erythraea TaxID=1836 RepID=UPI001BAA11B3|nr:DUF4097 family beta strand repeat-containing protein [Saccharopolyspora erythraea]QUH03252.1 DUF4097 family beta strand repeat protein [Saccharopolyspora erythraea]
MPVFSTPEPISATVDIVLGTARIVASDRTDTVVEVRPSRAGNSADVKAAEQTRVEFSNGVLLVKAPKQYGFFTRAGSIDVVVELPAGSDLRAEAAAGKFQCEGRFGEGRIATASGDIRIEEGRTLRLETSSGDIAVERAVGHTKVTGAGDLRIREIDGTAEIKNIAGQTWVGDVSGDVRLSSAAGDIVVDRAGSGVRAKTASGDIRLGEVVRGSVTLETASGELEVGIGQGTAAWLDTTSMAGTVRNHMAESDGPGRSDETVEVRARTFHGDIVIRRAVAAD